MRVGADRRAGAVLPGDPGAGRAEPALRADPAAAAGRRLVADADRPGVPHRLRQLRQLRPGGPAVPDAAGAAGLEPARGRRSCTRRARTSTDPTYPSAAKTEDPKTATVRVTGTIQASLQGNGNYSVPSASAAGGSSDAPPPFQLVKVGRPVADLVRATGTAAHRRLVRERLPAPQPVLLRSDGQVPGSRPGLRAAAARPAT